MIALMSETQQPFSTGWKVAIVIALVAAIGNSGISTLREDTKDSFMNHEGRLDELENAVFGNDIGTAPREESHAERIKALESRLDELGNK